MDKLNNIAEAINNFFDNFTIRFDVIGDKIVDAVLWIADKLRRLVAKNEHS